MRQVLAGLDFVPVIPLWLLGTLGVLALAALLPALLRIETGADGKRRLVPARGALLRLAAFAALALALANPRLVEETRIAERTAVVPTITGTAWITGFASYVVDPTDPFPEGYTVGDLW